MQNVWVKALFVQQPTIFGRKLKPFSLAHGIALTALGSPFMTDQPAQPIDLYVALEICRRDYATLQRDFFRISSGRKFLRWLAFGGQKRWRVAEESFRTYLLDHVDVSPRKTDGVKASTLVAPHEFHLVYILCSEYRYSIDSAWNETYVRACALFDVYAERNGDESLVDEGTEAVADMMRLAYAAHERGDMAEEKRLYEEASKLAAKNRGAQ